MIIDFEGYTFDLDKISYISKVSQAYGFTIILDSGTITAEFKSSELANEKREWLVNKWRTSKLPIRYQK